MTILDNPTLNTSYSANFTSNTGYEIGAAESDNPEMFWIASETYEDLTINAGGPEKVALEALWRQTLIRRGELADQPVFTADSWSFCIIKPDAKLAKMDGEIHHRIKENGLTVVASRKGVELNEVQLDKIWAPPIDAVGSEPSPWWRATVNYMTSEPVDMVLVSGDDASEKMKNLKARLREERYGEGYQDNRQLSYDERVKSIIHTSDGNPELFLNTLGFWTHSELARIVRSTRNGGKYE